MQDMATIGPQLKSAREQLGITAVEAAKRLHMRAMFVEALEREDWGAIGEAVYVRGFIRNYARMLGLDPGGFVESFNATQYAERSAAAGLVAVTDVNANTFAVQSRRRFRYPWLLTAMSALAILLVVRVVWTMMTPNAAGHSELQTSQASATQVGTQLPAQQSAVAVSAYHAQPGVDLRLELTQSCWLSVSVDGKRVVYETLPAGTVKQFHGVREISLRAGNAGGVVATIDGQTLGTLGNPGQVKDKVFAVKLPPNPQSTSHE
jgi:cytoskeletal protein RodZ